jgi:competence ComEA-like helix-hairpin-helix protein
LEEVVEAAGMGDRDNLEDSAHALTPGREGLDTETISLSPMAATNFPHVSDDPVNPPTIAGSSGLTTAGGSNDRTGESDGCPAEEKKERCEDAGPSGFFQSLPKFSEGHRRGMRTATGVLLGILAIEWIVIATETPDPLLLKRGEAFRQQFRVEINSATWVEWLQLEGIGPSLAHRIVAYRRLNGPFQTIEEVGRVPGIGPATLDRIRPWLTMHHDLSEPQIPAAVPSSSLPPAGDAHRGG